MTLTTILCPLDFSAASVALVAYAAALAVGTGAELRLLYVQEPAAPLAAGAEAALGVHRAAAEAAGASRVSTNTLRGEAAPEIVAEARRQHADLIVIGAHGQTGLSRFLMGNTAEVVVRTAHCPTLLVRE
ncbi:MAG: universal stress protein [Janthinobacterium lividum]